MTAATTALTEPPPAPLEYLESHLAALIPIAERLRDLLAAPISDANEWTDRDMDIWRELVLIEEGVVGAERAAG